ncbi:MAG: NADH-quinone oxidoreductase subunit NuoH [Chloroflexaceae bacterium]|nr:NADH-quinone oxidoreductase subunit NuoH [Chloroflexaceae bacterium]
MHIVIIFLQVLITILAVSTGFAYLTLFERRMLARFQNRVGPNRAGPWGIFQPLADAVKLFFKEDIIPSAADKGVYLLAPALAVIPALIIWAVIPMGCWNIAGDYQACFAAPGADGAGFYNILQIADVNIGVLYLMAVTSIGVYGITLAGWASNSKYSMLGGIRSAAQLISYELALGTAILGAVMMADTLSTREMVFRQAGLWFAVPQFLAFVVFLISATAELVRTPFDLVEAEQELTCGYNTEYGSMKFALFFMSEYVKMIALSAIGVTLFLGGWHFPGLKLLGEVVSGAAGAGVATVVVGIVSLLSFLLKVLVLLFLLVWLRASWPRVRYDMLMSIGWKWLLPLAFINVVVTAVVVGLAPEMNPLVQGIILLIIGVAVLWGATFLSEKQRSNLKVAAKAAVAPTGGRQ